MFKYVNNYNINIRTREIPNHCKEGILKAILAVRKKYLWLTRRKCGVVREERIAL